MSSDRAGFTSQIGVWDRLSHLYEGEIDRRFLPVVEGVIERASLRPGEQVLDLGNTTHFIVGRLVS